MREGYQGGPGAQTAAQVLKSQEGALGGEAQLILASSPCSATNSQRDLELLPLLQASVLPAVK